MIDIQEKKSKIISFLRIGGPSLPVRIAKTIEMDPVFASAILSELIGTKQIKTSHMKIGSSPLYLLPGQEQKLEDHVENLKSIEQEAQTKLKQNKTLTDENEEPSIRVALRNIKDFAIPFKSQDKIMWKYAFDSGEEPTKIYKPQTTNKIEPIFKKTQTNKKSFLKKIEEFLEKQNTKIISIEEVDKKKVIAKIQSPSQPAMLFAFNKKRITENELMKCYKKAKASNLPYYIITTGEPTKKMNDTIDAYKKLIKINNLKL